MWDIKRVEKTGAGNKEAYQIDLSCFLYDPLIPRKVT